MRRNDGGLISQLRRPPGGRDARIMLFAQFLDRTGSGVWGASSVLYFTFVAGLGAQRLGLLLGTAGVAGIVGSPVAGRLAERLPVRWLLIGCHLLRLGTFGLLLMCTSFTVLLPVVAVTSLGDRAAKTLEMLFATRVAGEQRSTYQALFRSVANAGYAVGAGIAAIGLAVGTRDAYRALILLDALSFVLAAALVSRAREPRATPTPTPTASAAVASTAAVTAVTTTAGATTAATLATAMPDVPRTAGNPRTPWRDRGYLRFVLLDIPMNLDDAILNVGLPLWLVHRTKAPHALIPAFLIINTVLVVVLQLRVSAKVRESRQAAGVVALYGATALACCAVLAVSAGGGAWTASIALLAVAVLVTFAELIRSVSSWELAVSLAPSASQASYLGVAGMAQSIQKSAGPLLLTSAVMAAGPAGWLILGTSIAGLSVVQRRGCLRRLSAA
jgi:MFS family permease